MWHILFLIYPVTLLFSAGPVLHLWTAERFCEINEIRNEGILKGIIVGTEFPDIRYITHAPRELTHPVILDIGEISQSTTPFETGMKLHAWLDLVRENFIPQEVYDAVAPHAEGFSATLLKFIEEEILADFYDGRQWSSYFDNVLPEELAFASVETVFKWHGIIQWTMAVRPSWLLWAQSYRGPAFGVSADALYNWSYLLPELRRKPIFQQYMQALLTHIEAELQKEKTFLYKFFSYTERKKDYTERGS